MSRAESETTNVEEVGGGFLKSKLHVFCPLVHATFPNCHFVILLGSLQASLETMSEQLKEKSDWAEELQSLV